MHSSLITGSMPGIAASTNDTCELGSPPNAVEAPENSFDREVTWAWTSMPTTTSQSPVAPLISFEAFGAIGEALIDTLIDRKLAGNEAAARWPFGSLVSRSRGAPQGRRSSRGRAGTSLPWRRWPGERGLSEVAMTHNRAPNGALGAVLGALIAVA